MISICARAFDPLGVLLIEKEGVSTRGLDESSRRASVTRTLDGGAAVYDTGASAADRTLTAHVQNASQSDIDTAARLIDVHPDVTVALSDGVYLATPERRFRQNADMYLVLQFREKLS